MSQITNPTFPLKKESIDFFQHHFGNIKNDNKFDRRTFIEKYSYNDIPENLKKQIIDSFGGNPLLKPLKFDITLGCFFRKSNMRLTTKGGIFRIITNIGPKDVYLYEKDRKIIKYVPLPENHYSFHTIGDELKNVGPLCGSGSRATDILIRSDNWKRFSKYGTEIFSGKIRMLDYKRITLVIDYYFNNEENIVNYANKFLQTRESE